MRTRTWKPLAVAWAACAAWLGCNALLGNETATYEAPATPDQDGAPGPDAPLPSRDGGGGADADAGPCVDVSSNPHHCGACGRDCLGGACVDGGCAPVRIAVDDPGPTAIAVDGTHVYWLNKNSGDLWSVPIEGGDKTLLFDGPEGAAGNSIAVHGGSVYTGSGELDAGVVRCAAPRCDGGAEYVVKNRDVPVSVFITDAGSLYFTQTVPGGTVERCQLPCRLGTETIASGAAVSFPNSVSVGPDETQYWTTSVPFPGRLMAKSTTIRTIAPGPVTAVTPTAGEVYYILEGTGPMAVPLDGGAPRPLRTVMTYASGLALGTDVVYATNHSEDLVLACSKAGCGDAGTVLASKQKLARAITVDARFIYWVNEGTIGTGGEIMRLAR